MLKMVKIPTAKNQMAAAIEAEYLRRRKKAAHDERLDFLLIFLR
jgi:hypothetical protein